MTTRQTVHRAGGAHRVAARRLALLRGGRRRPALATALVVLIVASATLSATRHQARLVLAKRPAVAAALRDPSVRQAIRAGWDSDSVLPVDASTERVTFYARGRILAEAAIRHDGSVKMRVDFTRLPVPYGDWLAYQPGVLLGLAIVFCLMACVVPLRRIRNLDALAALSLLAPVMLLQQRYVGLSVISSLPGLSYLLARCGYVALRRPAPPPASTPLYAGLTAGANACQRVRMMRVVLLALALCIAMVGISSPDAVDVIYAVMEGATRLVHGVLPYGHMPGDVIHGDTYPILSYALYAPLAWISPVRSTWDSVDVALGAAALAALLPALAMWRGGLRTQPDEIRLAAEEKGLRLALTWLSFPTLMITVSTGTTDVVLAAMLLFAVVLWRRPAVSTGLLVLAGWFKLAPFALVPIWLAPLRGRRLWAAVAAIVVTSALSLGLLVAAGGPGAPTAMLRALSYQFSRVDPQSVWAALGIGALQPIAEAGVLALIAGAAVRLHRDHELASDRVRVAALAAAVMLGLQLSADYWAFLYVVWIAPLVVVSVTSVDSPATSAVRAERAGAPVPRLVPSPSR